MVPADGTRPDAPPATLEEAVSLIHGLRQRQRELESRNAELMASATLRADASLAGPHEQDTVRMFMSAIDQCSESIFFTDVKGTILYVNHSFEEASGYSRAEVIGQTPRLLKSGHHPASFYRKMWATLLGGRICRCRIVNKRKDGELYVEEANTAPVRNDEGRIIGFVSVKTDITSLLENQRALEATNQELSRSNAELEQFAYVASHDLLEPLRSVSSCLQLLQKRYAGNLDARADEFIAHAVSGCQRMRDLIEALLTLSRVDAAASHLAEVDCGDALAEARANLSHAIGESGARITHDKLPMVCASRMLLSQLFQNLLSNALKFHGGQPPVVHVAARRDGEQWLFSVADQGIGIEPLHCERIFRLFQRLHSREEYPGTGLGLAICQKIVNRHGGRIWVESQPGCGSTFFFTLPPPAPSHTLPNHPSPSA